MADEITPDLEGGPMDPTRTPRAARKTINKTPKKPRTRGQYVHVELAESGPSMTAKHQAYDTDINTIMLNYAKVGFDQAYVDPRRPFHGDFSEAADLHTQMERVTDAVEAFSQLHPRIRHRFNNDPVMLLQFLEDPANHAEGVSLGLYSPREEAPTHPPQAEAEGRTEPLSGSDEGSAEPSPPSDD